jgi:hypothetical protein
MNEQNPTSSLTHTTLVQAMEMRPTPYARLQEEMAHLLLVNSLSTVRATIAQRAGVTHDGARDIYAACGYPIALSIADYYARYKRGDIAKCIIEAYPKACWKKNPEVWDDDNETKAEGDTARKDQAKAGRAMEEEEELDEPKVNAESSGETPFMKEWKSLEKKTKLCSYMAKADRLAGIGRYAVLFLGFDDGQDVSQPVKAGAKLLYAQAYREDCATIGAFESDVTNSRYGKPASYTLKVMEGASMANTFTGGVRQISAPTVAFSRSLENVHWMRCIHICEDPDEGEVYAKPVLESVWNRLQDIETCVSASGETFWRTGFQRAFAKIDPGEGVVFSDKQRQDFEDRFEDMMGGLKDWIVGQGLDIKTLSGQTADPTGIVDTALKLIGASKGIPYRLLTGSEEGVLAGTADQDSWNNRVQSRNTTYCAPCIVRPVIERLIEVGALPPPRGGEFNVEFDHKEEENPKDRAQIASTRVSAASAYLSGSVEQLIPPRAFLVDELGVDGETADAWLEEADRIAEEAQAEADAQMELAGQMMPFEQVPPENDNGQKQAIPQQGNKPGSPIPAPAGSKPQLPVKTAPKPGIKPIPKTNWFRRLLGN